MVTKKRRPIVAALLSIVTPGLGQVYNGQVKKGIVFYFVIFLLPVLMALTGLQYQFYGMLGLLVTGIAFYLFIAGEALFAALKIKELGLRPYNKWYYYFLIVIFSIGINTLTDDIMKREVLGIKAYKIPTGTMVPTLLIGDHIIVNLKNYRNNSPEKGDIIVFKYPEDPLREFIKRIVATEGDIIESKDKVIFINGIAVNEA